MRSRAFVRATVAVAVGLAGCAQAGTKAGTGQPAVVLHLATAENAIVPDAYADDARFFAERVEELTNGSIEVELDFEVIPWSPTSEQTITGMVRGGEVELAFVPTRAFDLVDISGFEALQAPMLIDSPELAGTIATDDLAAEMLTSLDDDGVIGLGLVFEGLRRPLAVNGAITRATDFQGLLTRVPGSNLSDRIFTALGAVPDNGASHVVGTSGDAYVLVETEFVVAGTFPAGSTVTANMVLFPKFNAILANPGAFRRLTDSQQRALRQAGEETAIAAVETTAQDEETAGSYCEWGGHVVLAPDSELHAVRARLSPVMDELRADPATTRILDAIEALKASTPAPVFSLPPACLPPTGDGARLPEPPAAPRP